MQGSVAKGVAAPALQVGHGELGPGLVELPDVETLVLLQATVDGVRLVALRGGSGEVSVRRATATA